MNRTPYIPSAEEIQASMAETKNILRNSWRTMKRKELEPTDEERDLAVAYMHSGDPRKERMAREILGLTEYELEQLKEWIKP